jgi:hypothetical protein
MESGAKLLTSTDLAVVTSSQTEQYGAVGATGDGRRYRYVQFGGTVTSGNLLIAPTLVSNHQNIAVATAAAKGDATVNVTLGSTAATKDQYADGLLVIGVDGSGVPVTRRIKGNDAANSAASCNVYLYPSEPLLNALTTSNKVSLSPSLFNGVTASSTAGEPVGVAVNSGSANQFGWVQTYGPVGLVNDAGGSLSAGGLLEQSTSVAGAVAAGATAGNLVIGRVIQAAAASKAFLARVTLD